MKFYQRTLLVIVFMCIFVGYQLLMVINKPNPVTSLLFWDSSGYSVGLLQGVNGDALPRDTLYGNRVFSKSMWLSSFLYMSGLTTIYELTGENIEVTLRYFRILLLALYLPVMFIFLISLQMDWRLALMISIVSSFPAYYTVTNSSAGIPPPVLDKYSLLPQILYSIELPLVALFVCHFWFKPGYYGEQIQLSHMVGIGALVGIGIYVFHAISSLGLIEYLVIVSVIQAIRRKLPWWTIAAFLSGLLPFLISRMFLGSGTTNISPESARLVIDIGRDFMVFPWTDGNIRFSYWHVDHIFESTEQFILTFFALYWIATLVGLWLMKRSFKFGSLLFLTAQVCLGVLHISSGTLLWFLGIYGVSRILRDQFDEIDFSLIALMSLGILLGTFQQILALYTWEATRIDSLIGIIYEVARFQQIFHLPFYLLLARAIWNLTSPIKQEWIRILVIGAVGYLTILNQVKTAFPIAALTIDQAVLLVIGAMLAVYPAAGVQEPDEQAIVGQRTRLRLLAAVAGIVVFLGLVTAPFFSPGPDTVLATSESDYLDMAEWVKNNTPEDSLIHLSDLNASFRYFAERSMLIAYTDTTAAIYGETEPTEVYALQQAANDFRYNPTPENTQRLVSILRDYKVNYLITVNAPIMSLITFDHRSYAFIPVYRNAAYIVYRFHVIDDVDNKVTMGLPEDALPMFNRYQPDFALEEDSIILNPLSGDQFSVADARHSWGTYLVLTEESNAINYRSAEWQNRFDLLKTFPHLIYPHELSAQDLEIYSDWASFPSPDSLEALGVDYILLPNSWLRALPLFSQLTITKSPYYKFVMVFPEADKIQDYFLYQVVSQPDLPAVQQQVSETMSALYDPQDLVLISTDAAWKNAAITRYLLNQPPDEHIFDLTQDVLATDSDEALHSLEQIVRDSESFWYISLEGNDPEQTTIFPFLEQSGFSYTLITHIDPLYSGAGLKIYLFKQLPPESETGVIFGENVFQLHSYSTSEIVPCQSFSLETWWSIDSEVSENYYLSLFVSRADGRYVTQWDSDPGGISTTAWLPGEFYPDVRTVFIPCDLASGNYQIGIRVYSLVEGSFFNLPIQPIPASGATDALIVEEFQLPANH